MQNPHQEHQSMLLARIIKNVDKCNEAVRDLGFHLEEILSHPSTYEITVASRLFESYNRNVAYNLGRIGAQHQQQQQAAPSSGVEAEEKQTRLA